MEKPKPTRPPIAPKPTIKKPRPIEEGQTLANDSSTNNERSSDSSNDSNPNSDNSLAVADPNSSKLNQHPCISTISNDNHKQLKSSVSTNSPDTTASTSPPPADVPATSAVNDAALTPPPRTKRSAKLKKAVSPDVKLREKTERDTAERNSRPVRGTIMLKVSDLQAKVGDGVLKIVRSPVPKPRHKSGSNESQNQPAADPPVNASSSDLPKEKPQIPPVPRPRSSLILTQAVEGSLLSAQAVEAEPSNGTGNGLCNSRSGDGEITNSFPSNEEENNPCKDTDILEEQDTGHYGEIWVNRSPPATENVGECKKLAGLERAASAPVSTSSSPKIIPRRPSAPPPPPPTNPPARPVVEPLVSKRSPKKAGPTRPPPPVPKSQVTSSQSVEVKSSLDEDSRKDSNSNIYTDVDENVYHEPDTNEVGQEMSKNAPVAFDQMPLDEDSTEADDAEYMVPVSTLQEWPGQSAPQSPFAKAKTVTLESGASNVYEDLVSSSDDGRSSGTAGGRSEDVYSDFLDETFASEDYPKGSSSESEGEAEESEEARTEKLKKKAYNVAQEILTSEEEFYDKLVLLNIDFRQHLSNTAMEHGEPVLPAERTNKILNQLPQLANINEDLLKDFQQRLSNWEDKPQIADVFVRKGPFLHMYTTYIRDFQNMTTELDNAIKDYPEFAESLKVFERSDRCRNLQIRHYMLKPIQRIPQYRLLLNEYQKYLTSDSPDRDDTRTALEIVSKVADHANEAMKENDSLQSLLELQSLLVGDFKVIEPSRVLVRKGDVYKQSRKELQPRTLLLFNDYLVITTPQPGGHYKIKHVLPVLNMQVNKRIREEFQKEFTIITKKRSFTSVTFTPNERDEWVTILESTIAERERKIGTYNRGLMDNIGSKEYVLGEVAPVWIPDDRVTMCMICSAAFGLINRRHHCRACGKVVCGTCSVYRAPLKYVEYKAKRSCGACYEKLFEEAKSTDSLPPNVLTHFCVKGGKAPASSNKVRQVLKEVQANDVGEHSGYLSVLNRKKWEKNWFVLKEKVLYKYNACEDTAAIETKPLLGYTVTQLSTEYEGFDQTVTFSLQHPSKDIVEPVVFKSDTAESAEKWIQKMNESTTA